MTDPTEASRGPYKALPHDVEGFREIAGLALDLRASWNHASEQVWRALDPVLWDLTHNPWAVLKTAQGLCVRSQRTGSRVRQICSLA